MWVHQLLWKIMVLLCTVRYNSENKDQVGSVIEHFTWSDVQRNAHSWSNQETEVRMNNMTINILEWKSK